MRALIILTLFCLTSCFQSKTVKVNSSNRVPASGRIANCITGIKKFLNNSHGREYSFSRNSNARSELDRLIKENNLNIPQLLERGTLINKMHELKYLKNAEEKVALFDKTLPLSHFTRISDFSSLKPDQIEEMNEILKRLENWKLSENSGVNRLDMDNYLTQLALMGRDNPKGLLSYWYKIYGNPKDIINKWYLDSVYRDGLSGALGKFYQGRTRATMGADFKRNGIKAIAQTFKSIVSLSSVILDIIPIGRLNKVEIDPEKLARWVNKPYLDVENEIITELKTTAHIQLSKKLLSRLLVITGVVSMSYVTYQHFSQDTFDSNSLLLDFEVQMMANEIARYMAKESAQRAEFLDLLEPEEREDATMVEAAKGIWIEEKAKEIANQWIHTEINSTWNKYLRESNK